MKKTLTILAVLLGMAASGQNLLKLSYSDADGSALNYIESIHDSLYIYPDSIVWIRPTDTTDVILLVCDTSSQYYVDMTLLNGEIINGRCVDYIQWDTVYTGRSHEVFWIFGKEVLELHNTSEGMLDPDHYYCMDDNGKRISCFDDYWKHVEYLNEDGSDLKKGIVVWDNKNIEQ